MTGYPWTAWLWWIGGAAIGLLGVWLLYWSLLRDRSKGRRRCPKCWYNMSGTDSLTCSECGRIVKREKKLFKTRRRWRWACVAVMLFIGGHFVNTTPRMQKGGLFGSVPTSVLIAVFPWHDKMQWSTTLAYSADIDDGVFYELERRANNKEMWRWQRRQLAWIAADQVQTADGRDSVSKWQAFDLYEAIGEDGSVVHPHLFTYLQSTNSWIVKDAGYLLSIKPTDDPVILEAVAGLLEHEDEWVRERVPFYLVACAKQNPGFVLPKLLEAMHDPSPEVCTSAINAVDLMGPSANSLLPAVEELREHESEKVRFVANWVLQRISPATKPPAQESQDSPP